ncbi:hypothetical protein [uncultured Sphingomonas sp.]|uniref:hypothetical protein n=1 Tax=uncultured Sphingomonas sp. TaxID=158754 RepID=UPI0035CA48CF
MMIEAAAAAAGSAAGGVGGAARVTELGAPGGSQADGPTAARFQAAVDRADVGAVGGGGDLPPAVQGLFRSLDAINVQAKDVADYARTAEASGGQLTPGEMVQLTMRCQQFMFECQLTSNIANRSSDGVQQLFKQQG